MKFNGYILVYNDYYYITEVIKSLEGVFDTLFIIEGAFQSSIDAGFSPRSNVETMDKIYSFKSRSDIKIIHANNSNEKTQRQFALNLCRQDKCDYFMMIDADEVYKTETLYKIIGALSESRGSIFGLKIQSYNFLNSFNKYYNGVYPRVYKMTPGAFVPYANNVDWPDFNKGAAHYHIVSPEERFYHYNYAKPDIESFKIREAWLRKEGNGQEITQHGYNFNGIKYTIPIPKNEIFEFQGKHPKVMQENTFFKNNIYGDSNIQYES
jgi:hypothetical protein